MSMENIEMNKNRRNLQLATIQMLTSRYIILVVLLIAMGATKTMMAQRLHDMLREPGKCYAIVMIQDRWEYRELVFPIYAGEEAYILDNYVVDSIVVVELEQPTVQWVQKKSGLGLNEYGEEDLVWCPVTTYEEEYLIRDCLIDTSVTDEIFFETLKVKDKLIEEGGYTKWMEVICKDALTLEILQDIALAIGYSGTEDEKRKSTSMKKRLTEFQQEHDLPLGQLDIETLEFLGIEAP